MSWLLALLLTGIAAFVITNIDDMFLPIFFFSRTGPDLKKRHIVLGQYLGFAVLAPTNNPVARKAIKLQAKWRNARLVSGFL